MKWESIILASVLSCLFLAGWMHSITTRFRPPDATEQTTLDGRHGTPTLPFDPGNSLLQEARASMAGGNLDAARETLYRLLDRHPKSAGVVEAERLIGQMNWEQLLSPSPSPGKTLHTVRRGDSLASIAKQYNTNIELIQAVNSIEGTLIRIGQDLYVCTLQFSVVASPDDGRIRVMADNRLFKSYPAGFARIDFSRFASSNEPPLLDGRSLNPTLREAGRTLSTDDPANYLGAAQLTLNQRGLSIHGSRPTDPVANFTGPGRIRMHNEDILELYLILPLKTSVFFVLDTPQAR